MAEGLEHARQALDANDLDRAWKIAETLLAKDPTHHATLILMTYIAWKPS